MTPERLEEIKRDHGLKYNFSAECTNEIDRLRAFISASKRKHHECEDRWYSCQKAEDGYEKAKDAICSCGADAYNGSVDKVLKGDAQ